MSTIKVAELISANAINYKWVKLNPILPYKVSIVETELLPSKYGGSYFRLIFEILDKGEFQGANISSLVTYMTASNKIHKSFTDLMGKFFDLKDPEAVIDTDSLIGRRCMISVRDGKDGKWQRVTDIIPAK